MQHLSRIAIFNAVAKNTNFRKAADELGYTASAVSKQIQILEDELSIKLFIRSTRSVHLTHEGQQYYQTTKRLLDDLQELENKLHNLKNIPFGNLKISLPMSFGQQYLSTTIAKYASDFPHVQLSTNFDDKRVDIIQEEYDLAVRVGQLSDSNLIAKKIATCPIITCASQSYIDKHGMPDSPYDLVKHRCILYNQNSSLEKWTYQIDRKTINIPVNPIMKTNSAQNISDACITGVGIANIPIFSAYEHLKSNRLVNLFKGKGYERELDISILYPNKDYLPEKTKRLIEYIENTGKGLPWC